MDHDELDQLWTVISLACIAGIITAAVVRDILRDLDAIDDQAARIGASALDAHERLDVHAELLDDLDRKLLQLTAAQPTTAKEGSPT